MIKFVDFPSYRNQNVTKSKEEILSLFYLWSWKSYFFPDVLVLVAATNDSTFRMNSYYPKLSKIIYMVMEFLEEQEVSNISAV